jgi:hypothetical protein
LASYVAGKYTVAMRGRSKTSGPSLPVVAGTIERRILVNYVVDPDVLARALPEPFRPKTIEGYGVAGVCLIRLTRLRPRGFPRRLGISSENAAHRVAVEWDSGDGLKEGVYIPRRDTSSRVTSALGGRLFPGVHHRARFRVAEERDRYHVELVSVDGAVRVLVDGQLVSSLPRESVFPSVEAASRFFERGAVGYSATPSRRRLDGLELNLARWEVHPLEVDDVASSFFEDRERFPPGSAVFDHALLMKGIAHEWHALEPLYVDPPRPG